MPSILDSLNPITGIITAVSGVLEKFIPNAEDKAKAAQALVQIQTDATLKLAELDQQFAASQASVITAEVKSDSWLARNWRPLLMVTFTYIIAHTYVLVPL